MRKYKGKLPGLGLAMLLGVFLLISACGKPREESKPADSPAAPAAVTPAPAEQPAPAPAPAAAVPAAADALVTFVSGDVEALRGSAWGPVGIGDGIPENATLKVREKSYCEIQFGNTGAVRINENTEVVLETIRIAEAGNQIGVKLDTGSVLAKVAKLGVRDKFQIRTGVAVCGVRGTEFGVTSGRDGRTVLKVKSGRVTVLPSTADVEMIGRKSETDERSRGIIEQAVAQVVESAPVVESNQEITLTRETLRRTELLIAVVEREIAQIVAVAPDKPEEKDKRIEEFAAQVNRQVVAALAKPAALSEANKKTMEVIETMALLDLPEAAPPATAPARPQPAAKPALRTLFITTVPEDADILLDGNLVGRGDLKRLLQEGTKLDFRVQREGYETKSLPVEVTPSASLDFKVELVPKPREVTIQAEPADADILVGGAVVGRGTYKGSFTPGTEVKIGVRKAGFEEKTLNVGITMDMAPVLRIALGKVSKEIRISVEPRDGRIFLGNAPIGTGSYQGIHNVGDRLVLRFQREGYGEQSRTLEVTEQGDNTMAVVLERLRKTLTLTAEPADAQISLNGRPVGRGTFSDTFDYGISLVFDVAKEGYVSKTLRIEVDERIRTPQEVRLERDRKDISVTVSPGSSTILLDGRTLGRGTYQGKHLVGEVLNFSFRNDGYEEKNLKIEVAAAAIGPHRVELEAKPVYSRFKASSAKIVGLVSYGADRLIGSDAAGKVFCVAPDGRVLWTAATANTPNESSVPVVIGDRVYFSGAKEFVIIDAAKGTVSVRQTLDSASANLFGRRVTPHPKGILFPANQNILVKDAATGDTLQTIKTGGDCMMTPLLFRDRIYIADQLGKVHILNAETGAEEGVLSTQALQPVAQAIQVAGSVGFFAGRRGNVVAFDLEKRTVLWQAKLSEDSSATVFHDAAVLGSSVYIFSKNMIYALSAAGGAPLHDPIKDIGAPPLAFKEMLYFGTTDNRMVVHSAARNRTEKFLALNARASSRPEVFRDEYVALGTGDGEIIIVNPAGIR